MNMLIRDFKQLIETAVKKNDLSHFTNLQTSLIDQQPSTRSCPRRIQKERKHTFADFLTTLTSLSLHYAKTCHHHPKNHILKHPVLELTFRFSNTEMEIVFIMLRRQEEDARVYIFSSIRFVLYFLSKIRTKN